MADLSAEERARIKEAAAAVSGWVTGFLDRTPEEALAEYVESNRRFADELNAKPLEDRLAFLAVLHDTDPAVIKASIADVTFAGGDDGSLNMNVLFTRSIEQVYFTVTVEDPDATGRRSSSAAYAVVVEKPTGPQVECGPCRTVWSNSEGDRDLLQAQADNHNRFFHPKEMRRRARA